MASHIKPASACDSSVRKDHSAQALSLQFQEFKLRDADAFYALNESWIKKYFEMEAFDHRVLGDPVGEIIQPGGHIYMAYAEEHAIGCCALVFVRPNVYEVAKMAVSEQYRGRGVGRHLLAYVIGQAQALGATLLTLVTNDKLANAIHLYESLGFRHLPPEPSPYKRANVFMELPLA